VSHFSAFHCSLLPSLLSSLLTCLPIYSFTDTAFTHTQIKGTESSITRIFGGKFRSTLRAPGLKDCGRLEGFEVGYSGGLFCCRFLDVFRAFFPGTFNIEIRTNIDLAPLARPDPHYSRCLVIHLASADGADYVSDSDARPTKNGQRRTNPTPIAAAAKDQCPTTGFHRGGEHERERPRKSSFGCSTSFGIRVIK
jgi:hypothetical protein